MSTEINPITEILSRAWIKCDPNRGGMDPDATIGQSCTGGTDTESVCEDTPLTGKPEWHWFIPRAEALQAFLEEHGYEIKAKA
jgi:hypothetical protein